MDCDVIIMAVDEAVNYNVRNFKYINNILNNWLQKGIKTAEGVRGYMEKWKEKKKAAGGNSNKKSTFCDYEQRDYDFDDLEKKLLGTSS